MKRFFAFSVISILVIFSCAKKEEIVKLEEGSPAYELAKDISKTLPYLDPDNNNILVSTKTFKISTGEVIQTIQSNLGRRANRLKNLNADRLKQVIEQNATDLAEKKLLLNSAKKIKIVVPETEIDSVLNARYSRAGSKEKFLKRLERNGINVESVKIGIQDGLTINRYLDETLASEILVTEEEIQKAYQEDKTATVRHILLKTQSETDSAKQVIRKKMEEILARAKSGEDIAELATKYSEDTGSKNNGGLYKNFGRGRMVKPFEEAAFSVPVGEISDIIETRYGYHILKVIERKKETRPLENIHQNLEAKIKRNKQSEALQSHIADLKKRVRFKIVEY